MADGDCITVALIGHPDPGIGDELRLVDAPATESATFRTVVLADDRDLEGVLRTHAPHVFLTFGRVADHPRLEAAPLDVRRRWLHLDEAVAPAALALLVTQVYVDVATNDRFPEQPLVSVFTPTYRTGERLRRPYDSLRRQTYTNWEWVVYDDSPDDETWDRLRALGREEHRLRLFRGDGPLGNIGELKRRLCGLARGRILVELDHDDELTDHCLADILEAFRTYPDAGFAYTDCAEVFDDGEVAGYPDGWGFGCGSYRWESYRGRDYLVTNYPSLNAKTVRHIVGVPNHVRAWRRSAYEAIGGHASEVPVADDYELLIRTFLATRMVHVQRFGYIQYLRRDNGNTQRQRNGEILRLVRLFHLRYEDALHARLVELTGGDFLRRPDGSLDWDMANPDPLPIANLVLR